ncbi:MAG: peptidoglycan editing factor PgeF [Bacillota bacterium]|nr:peptidoglycan editing factor PgeF [Bacillota bacterium]
MMRENYSGKLMYLTSHAMSAQDGLKHLFTSRAGGVSSGHLSSLNLGFSLGDERENVMENYRRVCAVLGVPLESIVPARQVHGDTVKTVTEADTGVFPPDRQRPGCDSLVTAEKGITLAVFYADCTAALFFDPKQRVIAAAHAGWRGTALKTYEKTVLAMRDRFGSRPEDMLAALSPSIGPCCYETDADVPEALCSALGSRAGGYIKKCGQKWRVDLPGLNRMILESAGLSGGRIEDSGCCTGCMQELFWSNRKTGGKRGVSGAFITMTL